MVRKREKYLTLKPGMVFVLLEISRLLNTGLDMESLSICVRLCEQGINPEALASVIKELRKATDSLKTAENMTG
uniref:mitotic-spindle organizing protein 1 isoform X1 n=1 Tax=Pristiophorus japonicus TaxID=55135 RepID=UPI00398E9CB2